MRRLALIAAVVLGVPIFGVSPAYAATITVTTTLDVVNGGDGLTSLREAIGEANAAADDSTIVLGAETYVLDLCGGASEDANASDDLDYTAGQVLTIEGGAATIEQTCADERVLHALDGTGGVVIQSATITGGEGFTGAAIAWANDLTLQDVTVRDNDAGGGSVLSSDDAVASGPTLNLVNSMVGPNTGTGVRISFGTVTITGSTVSDNSLHGVGLIDGALSVAGTVVQGNGGNGLSTTGQGEGLLSITDSEVTGNVGAGVSCSACGNVEITGSVISNNDAGGIVVNVDQDEATDELHVLVEESLVAGNAKTGPGAGLGVFILELSPDAPTAQITLSRSTFAENAAEGMDGRGGGVYGATGEVLIKNSTLDGNTAEVSGGGVFTADGDVFLTHATVTANDAPTGANIATGGDLHAFGSIVAEGVGGTDCAIAGTTVSPEYNVGGDGSCVLGGPTGDPLLGPLQDNGGPTPTRLPLEGSPAINAVPVAACTVLTIDQRGEARPQGGGCEAGSVELAAPGGQLPVSGSRTGPIVLIGLFLVGLGALLVRRAGYNW